MEGRLLLFTTVGRLSLPEEEEEGDWQSPGMRTATRGKLLKMVHATVGSMELEECDITH